MPSLSTRNLMSKSTIAPHTRLKDSFRRNQYVFFKFKTKDKRKRSIMKNKKSLSTPIDEVEKEEKIKAIVEAGFDPHLENISTKGILDFKI